MKKFPIPRELSEVTVGEKKLEAPHAFLLVYPNSYYLGMSNLGFHTVLSLIDSLPGWYAERAFLGCDRSLEKQQTFSSFDVIGFSISYEPDFLNLPVILRKGKIPLRSRDRGENHPLIMAGGVAVAINPEPIADLVDVMVIGEGEGVLDIILKRLGESLGASRLSVLKNLAKIKGVYIPRFYRSRYGRDGCFSGLAPEGDVPFPVRRNWAPDLDSSLAASRYLTPDTAFPRRGLIEIGRGCPWQCRFCAAGYLYRPQRNRSTEAVLARAREISLESRLLGLISPSPSDHPRIETLLSTLIREGFSTSLSSLRIESVSGDLMRTLAAGGQSEITLAPEAGTERLRKKINKDIPESAMADILERAREAGLSRVKLYFLVGLPGETKKILKKSSNCPGGWPQFFPSGFPSPLLSPNPIPPFSGWPWIVMSP